MRFVVLKAPLSEREKLEEQGWEYVGKMEGTDLHRFRRPESEVSFTMRPIHTNQKQKS